MFSIPVYSIVENVIQAEIMVELLRLNGFSSTAISVLFFEEGPRDFKGIAVSLIDLGIPEYEAGRCEAKLESGGILISVLSRVPEETRLAKKIFEETCVRHFAAPAEAKADEREAVAA